MIDTGFGYMATADGTTPWRAGTADRIITPDESMWMAGFGGRDKPSEGVHQDLQAKAIVLEDDRGTRVAIVSLEILFVGRSLRQAVVERCKDAYDLDPSHILLNASHTHQGPVTRTSTVEETDENGETKLVPKQDGSVNFIPIEKYQLESKYREQTVRYGEFLEDTVVGLVGEAIEGLAPAELEYGKGHCGSAMSRRRPYEDGIAFRPYSFGPKDHEVPVLAVSDPNAEGGEAIRALLFGYACHTTVQFLYEFSGDWAGYTQRMLEHRFPNATAIFLMGCGGDQKAYPQREQRFTEGHAQGVALAVEGALESVLYPVRGPLTAVYEEIGIPFEGPPSDEEIQALCESDDPTEQWRGNHLQQVREREGEIPTRYPYAMQTIGFGTDLTMLALAGEVLAGYSTRLKEELDGHVWVSGYSNNAFTYVPTRRAIAEGGYEGERIIGHTTLPGKWEPDLEERIVEASHALVDRVRTP